MIDFRKNEIIIVEELQKVLSTSERPCAVIRGNQVAPIPLYPYVSYNVITPIVANNKQYCIDDEGNTFKELKQIWSFTVQSNDSTESQILAAKAFDWFSYNGNTFLSDNNIVAQSVTNITNRDNLLSVGYEYRNGFDVTFNLMHKIENLKYDGEIESMSLKAKEE